MFTRRKRFKLDGGDVDKSPPPKDPGGEALTNIEIVNSSENGTPLKNPWVETLCKQPLPPPDYQEGETLSEGGKEAEDYDKEQEILKRYENDKRFYNWEKIMNERKENFEKKENERAKKIKKAEDLKGGWELAKLCREFLSKYGDSWVEGKEMAIARRLRQEKDDRLEVVKEKKQAQGAYQLRCNLYKLSTIHNAQ